LHEPHKEHLNIHASCVQLGRAGDALGAPYDAGVLLLGASGAGKSDLALRLLEKGAVLVADDRTELFVRDGLLMARAPARLRGLIEIRGVGIVEFPCAEMARIVLAVVLGAGAVRRLPEAMSYEPPPELGLPPEMRPALIHLDGLESSAPAKVIAAVVRLRQSPFPNRRQMP
jgi:HPr kinase/phosphorylase